VWQYDPTNNTWNQVIAGTTTSKLTEADKTRLGYAGIGMMNLGKVKEKWGIDSWADAPAWQLGVIAASPWQLGAKEETAYLREALMNYAFAQSGKTMSWKEVEMRYNNFIPKIGDSTKTMRNKLQNLEDSIILMTQTGLMPAVESTTTGGSAGGLADFEE
jgi:hypothetical protein